MTGSVVRVDPETPATGWVVNANEYGAPVILKLALVTLGNAPLEAVRVTPVAYELAWQAEKAATPLTGVTELQPPSVSPALMASVIDVA
jgi:hypothetical protein